MSAFKSNAIALTYYDASSELDVSRDFNVLSFEDDDFEIIKINATLLNRNKIETTIGHRKKYRIRFNKLSTDDISFLYNFVIKQTQRITFNCDGGVASYNDYDQWLTCTPSIYSIGDVVTASGVSGSGTVDAFVSDTLIHLAEGEIPLGSQFTDKQMNISRTVEVKIIDEQLAIELIGGYVEAPYCTMEFEDNSIVAVSTTKPLYRNVGNTDSAGKKESAKKGISTVLTYDYSDGDVSREFNLNLAESYSIAHERIDFEYIDRNRDRANLGFYQLFNLEFGALGRQTQIQKQDDIEFIREFCLAPTKKIYIYGMADSESVVCDFDEVGYEQVSSIAYLKSLGLRFISKNLQTTIPTTLETWNLLSYDNWQEMANNWETYTG